jgi:putative ATPase
MAQAFDAEFIALRRCSGVKDIRDACWPPSRRSRQRAPTILFVDEVHRFNKAQQDAFLPYVEGGSSPSSARRRRTRPSK